MIEGVYDLLPYQRFNYGEIDGIPRMFQGI